jgi:hypothetical protein
VKTRRWFHSNKLYEACIRVRSGIPFPALLLIKVVLEGIIARVQRDSKITLCHLIWLGNHAHIIFVLHDGEQCSKFFSEVQKQITEAIKKLTDVSHLRLWEGEPSIAIILDHAKAMERIRYLYCNPARANLIDSIENYPGMSTWEAFKSAGADVGATVKRTVPWIRRKHLPVLGCAKGVSRVRDRQLTELLLGKRHPRYELVVKPNAWLAVFGITDPQDVAHIRTQIRVDIEDHEQQYREERRKTHTPVAGPELLASTPILKSHTPTERSRRIFVLSSISALRVGFIAALQNVVATCRELYERLRLGEAVSWPLGVFAPRPPNRANLLEFV